MLLHFVFWNNNVVGQEIRIGKISIICCGMIGVCVKLSAHPNAVKKYVSLFMVIEGKCVFNYIW